MKLFKTLRRKAGNAILPVVGTLLGLTILAGSVVGVALNSSKIVYRKSSLQKQNDARQILYIASKYFSSEMNAGKKPETIALELKEIFGPGLKVTQSKTDENKFFIWYPNKYKTGNEYTTDANVAQWLKATITKTEQEDENGDHGNTGINNTMFGEEPKIDEKFSVGNMMTVYMTDEGLLPGRSCLLTEISIVEADIDTFDEAFTYMNNTGVLEIDDIVTTLYYYSLLDSGDNPIKYIETPTYETKYVTDEDGKTVAKEVKKSDYAIIYKTGNLGGNYYWQYGTGTQSESTWLYRQEFDNVMLYNLVTYVNPALIGQITADNIVYTYNDVDDSHVISTNNNVDLGDRFEYTSSRKFALDLADYVFWDKLPRLCMLLDDFVTKIHTHAANRWSGHTTAFYEDVWKDKGITIYTYSSDGHYWDWDYTDTEIINFLKELGYTDNNGQLSKQKIYDKLSNKIVTEQLAMDPSKADDLVKILMESGKLSFYQNQTSSYLKKGYHWDDDKWRNTIFNVKPKVFMDALKEFLLDQLNMKYVTGYTSDGSGDGTTAKLSGRNVESINTDGLSEFQCILNSGSNIEIRYHFRAKVRVSATQVDDNDYFSGNTGDTFYFKNDGIYMGTKRIKTVSSQYHDDEEEFFEVFAKTFLKSILSVCNIDAKEYFTTEELTVYKGYAKSYLMSELVEPVRYRYLPNDDISDILGSNSSIPGMKQQTITNKLVEYYFTNSKDTIKSLISDTTKYKITINSATYNSLDKVTDPYDKLNTLNYVVDFTVDIDSENDGTYATSVNRRISFLIKYETYNGVNNPKLQDGEYVEQPNGNLISDTDGKHVFGLKPIKDETGNALSKESLESGNTMNVITAIPLTIRNDELYGTHRITIDGNDYTVATSESQLYTIAKGTNVYYHGNINGLAKNGTYKQYYDYVSRNVGLRPVTRNNNAYTSENIDKYDRSITVKEGATLFIDGNLRLRDDEDLILEKNAMIFINGNFEIEYEYKLVMDYKKRGYSITYKARDLTTENIQYFKQHGVDVKAAANAKILVNGNMTYRGYKAKYASSASGNLGIYNDPYENQTYDLVYEQYVFDTAYQKSQSQDPTKKNCKINSDKRYDHYTNECKSKLSGIYIVNGDVKFVAWADKRQGNNYAAMYRNMYSNPLINATFYVDGAFDMRGLYTSGLYDTCRANFIFAKSIVEPEIAFNTVLCAGADTQYGAWDNSDGYLFIICEDAVEFSQETFAHVNIFTPFNELVNSIRDHNDSALNFSKYISKGTFSTMYPDQTIIDEWGLPTILKSGLKQLYSPGDIGSIKEENVFNENGDKELGVPTTNN